MVGLHLDRLRFCNRFQSMKSITDSEQSDDDYADQDLRADDLFQLRSDPTQGKSHRDVAYKRKRQNVFEVSLSKSSFESA